MSETMAWRDRVVVWLRDLLTTWAARLWGDGWVLIPVHEDDTPGLWIPEHHNKYQEALALLESDSDFGEVW